MPPAAASLEPASTLERFKRARHGLFLQYGVDSLLGRGEWVHFREQIPVAEYERLIDRFTAERFDDGAICDLALDAGMHDLTITTLGDGSIHPEDEAALREMGRRLRSDQGGN